MTSSVPQVSVLMTVRDGERFVAAAVQSVLQQDLDDLELIVVDDGSTDRTLQILDEFAAADDRLRVERREAEGIAQATNHGLSLCRAPLVARLDADDLAKPHRLQKQVAFLNEHPEVVCCGSWVDYIDHKDRFLTTIRTPPDHERIDELTLRGHGAIFHPSCMIRKSALERIGGYDSAYQVAVDLDLWLRLGEVGRLANIQEALTQYRLHNESVSESRRYLQRDQARQACEAAWKRRGIEGVFEASEPWRPGMDRASRHEFSLRYGWWALGSRQMATAFSYGWEAVKLQPWRLEGWRLMAVSAAQLRRRS